MISPLLSARVWFGAAAVVLVIWLAMVGLFGLGGIGRHTESVSAATVQTRLR